MIDENEWLGKKDGVTNTIFIEKRALWWESTVLLDTRESSLHWWFLSHTDSLVFDKAKPINEVFPMFNFLNGSSSLWIPYGVIRHEFMLQS